jgi:hypothetical protein
MFWRKKKKFTDDAIAYLKASHPDDGTPTLELPAEATPVVRRYSDDLCICYLVDRGSSYEYIQQSHIEQDGIDRDELHRIGLSNLRAWVARRQARVQPYQGVFAFLMHGDFEASVILLDDLWDGEFRGLSRVSMPPRYRHATSWRSATAVQPMASPSWRGSLRDYSRQATICSHRGYMCDEIVDGFRERAIALQRTASPPSVRAWREFVSAPCAPPPPPRPSLSLVVRSRNRTLTEARRHRDEGE